MVKTQKASLLIIATANHVPGHYHNTRAMQYLIFDATPISKPKSYSAPFSDTFSWPRLIHLSWIVLDEQYKPVEDYDCVIKPEGFAIDDTIADYAKLDLDDIDRKGEPLTDVLTSFSKSVEGSDYIFAHNMNVAENVLGAEYVRQGLDHGLFRAERFCLMQEATYFCKLPSKTGGYKWPTLRELHISCFNSTYSPVNNARADVIAASRSFIYLMKTGQLEDLWD